MSSVLIYKYPLRLDERQRLTLPAGAEILSIQMQGNQAVLWAKFFSGNAENTIDRVIEIIPTGQPADAQQRREYISTVQIVGAISTLVLHFFEVL